MTTAKPHPTVLVNMTNDELGAEWAAMHSYPHPDFFAYFGIEMGDLLHEAFLRGLTTTDLEELAISQGL